MKRLRLTGTTLIILSIILFTACGNGNGEEPYDEAVVEEEGEQLLPDPGVVSFSYRNQFSEDVPGTLDMILDLGITNIEFSSLFGYTAAEMREMLDERGMVCTSYGVGYNDLVDNTDQVIEDARTLGAEFVRVASIPHDRDEGFTVEDARRAIEDFEEAGRILREEGLMFLYHNHGFEFRPHEDGTLFDYMVRNSDPEYVNFEMDVAWVVQPGHDPVELLQRYPDRFYATHLKDMATDVEINYSGTAPRSANVEFGTGLVDFPAFLRAAEESNIRYHYIEYEDEDVVEMMPRNIEYLTNIRR